MFKIFSKIIYHVGLHFSEAIHLIVYILAKLFSTPVRLLFHKLADSFDVRIYETWEIEAGKPSKWGHVDKRRSWDVVVHSKEIYSLFLAYQLLGVGNGYIEGLWEVDDIAELMYRLTLRDFHAWIFNPFVRFLDYFKFHLINLQDPTQGNDLFEKMLDKNMNYSCGSFKNTEDLDQAQINKMDLIAKKLKLKPGMRVLDVGCGWGGMAKYLAENYKVSVVGCTVSKEGGAYAQKFCEGLDVDIRIVDYRDIQGEEYDRIYTIGAMEHFGHKNYKAFFKRMHSQLKPDGLFLVHTIGVHHTTMPCADPWICKYIFVNGAFPRSSHLIEAMDGLFILEDWHNFGHYYHLTLKAWLENFEKSWPQLKNQFKDPTKFYRMWTYYLKFFVGLFRSRKVQLWQIVLSKDGVIGGYESLR